MTKNDHKIIRIQVQDPLYSYLDIKYRNQPYPTDEEEEEMANELGISNSKVKTWFRSRRLEDKKQASNGQKQHPVDGKSSNIQIRPLFSNSSF